MNPRVRLAAGAVSAALALTIGVLAAWPIYQTAWLWLVAGAALVLGGGVAWARERLRLRFPVFVAVALGVLALTVVPIAVPQALGSGPLRGLGDGLAAIALGWKQLLTLTLPVGTYQAVLVPAYVVMFVSALLIVFAAQRPGRWTGLAAIPMLAPVAFGTVFGSSVVSASVAWGPWTIAAPHETGLWLAAAALAAVWVSWTSGAERRAALRLGRVGSESRARRGLWARVGSGAALLVVALVAGSLLAPVLDAGDRTVPRDRVDPELVVRDQPSPLATYRTSKRDDTIDSGLFRVSAKREAPDRLRLAVLDTYDGVDFHVSGDAAGRFTRFPSGEPIERPGTLTIEVLDGYTGIWAPTAGLGAPPRFTGPRSAQLADAFYVNRASGAAIAVPEDGTTGTLGLVAGDGYVAEVETAAPAVNPADAIGDPIAEASLIDLEQAPELARWVTRQGLSADAESLVQLTSMLRERGYLSHAMSEGEGSSLWLERLNEEFGTKFESSAGGHSLTRTEALFSQLNAQQLAAGEGAADANLVAAIGDDEQFATAAALVARSLGYDSRVVVGVRLAGEEVPGVPFCSETCTGESLAAWIEVRGTGGEWVALDATPQVAQAPQRLEQGEQLPEYPTTPEERDAQEIDPPVGLGERGDESTSPNEPAAASWLWPMLRGVGLSVAALVLLLIPILFLPVAKRLRARRRRREPQPELQALGAWEEMVDRARDSGVEIPTQSSRAQVAATLGTRPAMWAAAQVDRAVFSDRGLDAAQVQQLWQAVDADSAERRSTLSRGRRVRAAYSLRSLGIGTKRRRRRREEGGAQ